MKKIIFLFLTFGFLTFPIYLVQAEAQEFGIGPIAYYYQKKSPALVMDELKSYLTTPDVGKGAGAKFLAYLYGRISHEDKSLVAKYIDLYDSASKGGKLFLINVFMLGRNEEFKTFLAGRLNSAIGLEKEFIGQALKEDLPADLGLKEAKIKNAGDLDFHWMEFFVSGDQEMVKKIMHVLEYEDLFQSKLQNFFNGNASTLDKQMVYDLLTKEFEVGIRKVATSYKVDQDSDLDIKISARLLDARKGVAFRQINSQLALSVDDLKYMGTKYAALESLRSYSKQHPLVFATIKAELQNLQGPAFKEVSEILIHNVVLEGDNPNIIQGLLVDEKTQQRK